ncbi:MAG TPA: DUF4397 domain-containing protein [Gammaproteobacteria bacterium]
MSKAFRPIAVLLLPLAGALAGCDDGGRVRPPRVNVHVVHVAPTTSEIDFLREERSEATVDYREVSGTLTFDADQYDFNIEVQDPASSTPKRIRSFSHVLVEDTAYLFVLTEADGQVEPIIVEKAPFSSSTDAEIVAVHGAPSFGNLDVYVEPEGSDFSVATPIGTLAFGETLEPVTRAADDYQVILTEAGNPANVLLTSDPVTLEAGQSVAFVVADGTSEIAPLSVVSVGTDERVLLDANVQSGFVLINAAADQAARDAYLDDDFTAPAVPALPFGAVSAVTIVPPGETKLTITPVGDTGALELEETFNAVPGRVSTVLLAGEPGDLSIDVRSDEDRFIAGEGLVRFMNGASQFTPLEFFLVPPGTDITDLGSLFEIDAPGISARGPFPVPEDYELLIRDSDTETIVAGPTEVSLTEGLYTILAVNGETSGTVDVRLLEGFD